MTPRPPIVSQGSTGTITNADLAGAGAGAGVSIVRRPSPKPRRTRKVSHRSDVTARSDRPSSSYGHTLSSHPQQGTSSSPENANSEIAYAYMPSEEEGVKGDDEGDYSDLLSAYSTDADA